MTTEFACMPYLVACTLFSVFGILVYFLVFCVLYTTWLCENCFLSQWNLVNTDTNYSRRHKIDSSHSSIAVLKYLTCIESLFLFLTCSFNHISPQSLSVLSSSLQRIRPRKLDELKLTKRSLLSPGFQQVLLSLQSVVRHVTAEYLDRATLFADFISQMWLKEPDSGWKYIQKANYKTTQDKTIFIYKNSQHPIIIINDLFFNKKKTHGTPK